MLKLFRTLKPRDFFILGIFWIFAAGAVSLMVVLFMLKPVAEHKPVYQLATGEITARTLFPLAQQAAQAWAGDVLFVSASATWEQSSVATLAQPVDWVYRFYSPGQQRMILVLVSPAKQVVVQPHLAKVKHEQRLVVPQAWQVDSPAALQVWLNQEGWGWLEQHPEATVSVKLTQDLTTQSPVWLISGETSVTGERVFQTIAATQ